MHIVLTGGGTAGHIYPAVNVGLYLREQYGIELSYIGRPHSMEEKIADANKIPFYPVRSNGLSVKHMLRFMNENIKGTMQARKLLKKMEIDYVFSTGGYVTAPVLAASKLLGIPYSIHEQNTVTGKVNKLFKKGAITFFESFPTVDTRQICYSGNPVRYNQPLKGNGEHVLVFGGSGGSQSLNNFAMRFARENPSIPMMLVTGEKRYQLTIANGIPDNIKVYPFVEDMMDVYKEAKMIICRSGSGTIFEVANLNIPPIFVPFREAADDHQTKNAQFLTEKGAGLLVEEGKEFHKRLSQSVLSLYEEDDDLLHIKEQLTAFQSFDTIQRISDRIVHDMRKTKNLE